MNHVTLGYIGEAAIIYMVIGFMYVDLLNESFDRLLDNSLFLAAVCLWPIVFLYRLFTFSRRGKTRIS